MSGSPDLAIAPQPDSGRSFRHVFEGPFFRRLLIGGLRNIPRPVQRLTMPLWAGLFYSLIPAARHGIEDNLDQVLGPGALWQRRLRSYRLFLNYSQALADHYGIQLGDAPAGARAERDLPLEVVSLGRSRLLGALARGRGVIALTGHLGMWQLGPFLAEWRDLPTFHMAMAEEPNALVQQFEEQFRSRFRVVYTTASPLSSLPLLTALREGAVVGMQLDRATGSQSIPLPFFGRTAWFPTGPAHLARVSGAPLVPLFFVQEPSPVSVHRHLVQYIEEPIEVARTGDRDADVAEATARVVRVYEGYVRRYPCQWYNFHDFWQRPPDRSSADAWHR